MTDQDLSLPPLRQPSLTCALAPLQSIGASNGRDIKGVTAIACGCYTVANGKPGLKPCAARSNSSPAARTCFAFLRISETLQAILHDASNGAYEAVFAWSREGANPRSDRAMEKFWDPFTSVRRPGVTCPAYWTADDLKDLMARRRMSGRIYGAPTLCNLRRDFRQGHRGSGLSSL